MNLSMSLTVTAIHPLILGAEIMLLPGSHRLHFNRLSFSCLIKKIWYHEGSWEQGWGTSKKQVQEICAYYQNYFFFSGWRGWAGFIILTLEIANVVVLRGDLNICRGLFLIYMDVDTETVVYVRVNVKRSQQVTLLVSTCGKRESLAQR